MTSLVTRAALVGGMLVPILYYGSQLIAAPSYPEFTFCATTASELGSDRAPHAAIFNNGIMLQGVVALFASTGFFVALRAIGTNIYLSILAVHSLTPVEQ